MVTESAHIITQGDCWCGSLDHDIDHGHYRGYQRHMQLRRAGHSQVDPCDQCRAANTAYIAQWRIERRDAHNRHMETQCRRDKALRRLAKLHRAEFEALYTEELSK